jgi:hypothetical protein
MKVLKKHALEIANIRYVENYLEYVPCGRAVFHKKPYLPEVTISEPLGVLLHYQKSLIPHLNY